MRFNIDFQSNSDIPIDFINKFLNISNPLYFVIYLYTFKRVFNGESNIDYDDISLSIEFSTENDVIATFKYFEQKGIINIDDETITFLNIFEKKNELKEEVAEAKPSISIEQKPVYDMREIELYRKTNEDFRNLFIVAERNFGRTLKQSDMFIIFDIYDRLMLPADVIEYLLEHYTSKGITNMTYMEKVATDWYDKDVRTKEDAMRIVNAKNEDYIRVRKALGMGSKRDKTYAEEKMFDKFYNEFGYSLDIILEGCDAAVMSSKESPSYKYLEGILTNWYNEGVKTVDDIKKRAKDIEENRKKVASRKTNKQSSKPAKNKFANFSQKSLDFDKYEKLNRERMERLAKGENVDGE